MLESVIGRLFPEMYIKVPGRKVVCCHEVDLGIWDFKRIVFDTSAFMDTCTYMRCSLLLHLNQINTYADNLLFSYFIYALLCSSSVVSDYLNTYFNVLCDIPIIYIYIYIYDRYVTCMICMIGMWCDASVNLLYIYIYIYTYLS